MRYLIVFLALLSAGCRLAAPIGGEIPLPMAATGSMQDESRVLAQRILVHRGDRTAVVDTLVEWSSSQMSVAGMSLGVGLGVVRWEGSRLQAAGRFSEWGGIEPVILARDLLYALLPVEVLRRSLRSPWRLDEDKGLRILRFGDLAVLTTRYCDPARPGCAMEIVNVREGYRLTVEAVPI